MVSGFMSGFVTCVMFGSKRARVRTRELVGEKVCCQRAGLGMLCVACGFWCLAELRSSCGRFPRWDGGGEVRLQPAAERGDAAAAVDDEPKRPGRWSPRSSCVLDVCRYDAVTVWDAGALCPWSYAWMRSSSSEVTRMIGRSVALLGGWHGRICGAWHV